MHMSRVLRNLFSRKPATIISLDRPPLFTRVPPWWAKWTYALVACDVFMTASAIELTWNRWTELSGDLEKISEKNKGKSSESPTSSQSYVPRPGWQRIGLCLGHLGVGIGIATALIMLQSRFVRTFTLSPALVRSRTGKPLPNQHQNRQVLVSCAHNWKNNGRSFPLENCSLSEGRDATELILKVDGERGNWHLGLQGALINGKKASVADAHREILAEWDTGRRTGQWTPPPNTDNRWRSGPVTGKPSRA